MGFEQVCIDGKACLAAEDSSFHDDLRRHFTEAHTDELEDAHVCLGEQGLEPEAKELADKGENDDDDDGGNDNANGKKCIHLFFSKLCVFVLIFIEKSTIRLELSFV